MALLFLVLSCKNADKSRFQVKLSYTNGDKMVTPQTIGKSNGWIFLEEIVYGKSQLPLIVDSQKISGASGNLNFQGKSQTQGIFELVFGDNVLAIPLINDGTEIQIEADLSKTKDFYTVTGSPASKQLQDLLAKVGERNSDIQTAFFQLDSLKKFNAPDSVLVAANNKKNAAVDQLNDYLRQFIQTTPNATLGVLALGWASRSFQPDKMETALKGLKTRFPGNAFLAEMEKNSQPQPAQQSAGSDSWIGKSVPELVMADPNGKDVSISSFKGKYVLIDFWASWCGPCRHNNPKLVRLYNKYHEKGLEIYGISLDEDSDDWKKAVQHDKLKWIQVIDDKGWAAPSASAYGVDMIPSSFLIDKQGVINRVNAEGAELEISVKDLLKD